MAIYLIDRDIKSEHARLDKIDPEARNEILDFVDEIKITGITNFRELFYLTKLRVIYNNLQDKFLNPEKKDIIRMLLASKVPEAPLENQMGRVHGSQMTAIYVHLSGRDQDDAILKAYGIDVKEDKIIEEKPKKCPRCDHLNASNALYCTNCFLPFDEKMALEYENKEKEIENKIEESNAIPEMTKKIMEKAPDAFKSQLMENILEEILKDPELLEKFRSEINK